VAAVEMDHMAVMLVMGLTMALARVSHGVSTERGGRMAKIMAAVVRR
jgi:hypothetical protein